MRKLLFLALFLLSKSLSAQNNGQNGPLTPLPVASPAPTGWTFDATAKYGLLDMVSGVYCIYLQPNISQIASLELGFGLTRRNHLVETSSNEDQDNWYLWKNFSSKYWVGPAQEDVEDLFYNYDNRSARTGSYFSVMPRVNFSNVSGFSSSFLGLKFEHRVYRWKADALLHKSEIEYSGLRDLNEKERQTNFLIVFGSQYSGGGFLVEWYTGVGTRKFVMKKRDNGINYVGNPSVKEYGSVVSTFERVAPIVELGVNIGFTFFR